MWIVFQQKYFSRCEILRSEQFLRPMVIILQMAKAEEEEKRRKEYILIRFLYCTISFKWGGREGWNLWTSDNPSDGVMFNNVSSDAVLQKTSRTSQARVTWTNWIMGMLDFLIWHVDTKPISVQKCEVYSGKFSLQNCQGICSTVLPLNAYYCMLDMIIIRARHFDSTQAEGRLLW